MAWLSDSVATPFLGVVMALHSHDWRMVRADLGAPLWPSRAMTMPPAHRYCYGHARADQSQFETIRDYLIDLITLFFMMDSLSQSSRDVAFQIARRELSKNFKLRESDVRS
jgi:hypothetical protein